MSHLEVGHQQEERISHSLLTDLPDGTGLWRLFRTPGKTLTWDSGPRSTGRTDSIDIRRAFYIVVRYTCQYRYSVTPGCWRTDAWPANMHFPQRAGADSRRWAGGAHRVQDHSPSRRRSAHGRTTERARCAGLGGLRPREHEDGPRDRVRDSSARGPGSQTAQGGLGALPDSNPHSSRRAVNR